jgi:RIO-like serine/threonine protein kinase
MMEAFSKAAAQRGEEMGIGLVEAILSERADLRDGVAKGALSVSFAACGKNAHTVFIGDEVFKGPWLNKAATRPQSETQDVKMKSNRLADFENEIEALRHLEDSGLCVPKVTCVGTNALFFGMTRMPCVMLDDIIDAFTPQQERELAQDLADFIIRMARALPMKDGKYAKHGDLHRYNILVSPDTGRMTSIIDFGKILYLPASRLASAAFKPEINNMIVEEFESRKHELISPRGHLSKTCAP